MGKWERDGREAMRMREQEWERETDREHKGGREMVSAETEKGVDEGAVERA